jgi:hypothetical protein
MAGETPFGAVNIRIIKFETRHTVKNGEDKVEDWVQWCGPGNADRAVNIQRMHDILRAKPEDKVPWAKRQVIEPIYQAWKTGQELPETGTPLGAWPGLQPDQAEVFKMAGVRTVEAVRDLTEGELTRIKLPNLRGLKQMAERFLAAKDSGKVAGRLEGLENENAALKEQLAELIAAVKADREDEPKRGPGRPRKEMAA